MFPPPAQYSFPVISAYSYASCRFTEHGGSAGLFEDLLLHSVQAQGVLLLGSFSQLGAGQPCEYHILRIIGNVCGCPSSSLGLGLFQQGAGSGLEEGREAVGMTAFVSGSSETVPFPSVV